MSTPFAATVLYLLTTMNNSGELAPVDKADLPPPYTTGFSLSEEGCSMMRGKLSHPERYVCQLWRGEKEQEAGVPAGIQQKPEPQKFDALPPQKPGSLGDVQVGPSPLLAADRPFLEPRVPKPVHRKQQQPPFDPLRAFVAMITPRANW